MVFVIYLPHERFCEVHGFEAGCLKKKIKLKKTSHVKFL